MTRTGNDGLVRCHLETYTGNGIRFSKKRGWHSLRHLLPFCATRRNAAEGSHVTTLVARYHRFRLSSIEHVEAPNPFPVHNFVMTRLKRVPETSSIRFNPERAQLGDASQLRKAKLRKASDLTLTHRVPRDIRLQTVRNRNAVDQQPCRNERPWHALTNDSVPLTMRHEDRNQGPGATARPRSMDVELYPRAPMPPAGMRPWINQASRRQHFQNS